MFRNYHGNTFKLTWTWQWVTGVDLAVFSGASIAVQFALGFFVDTVT